MARGNRIGLPVLVLLAAGLGVLSMPRPALAQSSIGIGACTWKCTCVDEGCGCSSKAKNGKGAGCENTGDGCFVASCKKRLAFIGEGTFAREKGADDSPAWEAVAEAGSSWETLPSGIAVARSCEGVIVGRFVDPVRAEAIRAETRVIGGQALVG